MAKATNKATPEAQPAPQPKTQKPEGFLPWPANPKDLPEKPRSFRVYRLNAYEWQCFVTEDGIELPIGKPDLIELVRHKMLGVMRAEGQVDFMAAKAKAAEGKPDAKK